MGGTYLGVTDTACRPRLVVGHRWENDGMAHDPYCPAPRDWWRTCVCDVIAQVRDEERWATVEGAVVIASQSGASPELVQLLSSMYERHEAPWTDEARREAAAELTRLAQEMGMIP